MSVTIEKKEKNFINLNMEVDAKEAMTEYNKACKRISERVNIAGFRKGKAPRNILEKHVGIESIKKEVLDEILPKLVSTAIRENKLDVISEPALESYKFELGENLSAVIKLELRPEIEVGEYKKLTIDVEEYQMEDDFMDKELEYVKSRFTSTEPVIGRKSKKTDVVVFDFDGFVDGEPIKSGSSKNYMLDLSNSNFIPGFAEQLVGHNISEEFEIDVTFPAEYHDDVLKGKDAKFKIKINEIKEKKVPELNDELAKKVGGYENLEELKKDIEEYAQKMKTAENDKRALEAIFTKLLGQVKVELSDTMIARESESIMAEMKERIAAQGANFDQIMATEGREKIMSEMREEAERRIKNSLLIHKISVLENIEVTPDDINKKVDALAKQHNTDKSVILNHLFSNQQMMSALGQQAISEKVAGFLIENNNINYTSEKPKAKPKAKAKKTDK